jgi:hypothetical protein
MYLPDAPEDVSTAVPYWPESSPLAPTMMYIIEFNSFTQYPPKFPQRFSMWSFGIALADTVAKKQTNKQKKRATMVLVCRNCKEL